MIDHLKQMAVFAHVVDEGSFRGAAKLLGVAPSRISETVSELEAHLGVTLLYRTTRQIALTSEGRILYGHVVEMLRSVETGLNELNALTMEPVGALRVSLPAFMAQGPMTTAISKYIRLHPHVAISAAYTDQQTRLIEDGFDVVIRVGWLKDSSLMSRKLADGQRYLVCGVEYARQKPKPTRPADLEDWDWIRFRQRPDQTEFSAADGTVEVVTGNSQIEADNIEAVYHMATENLGATVVPSYLAERGATGGKLVRLLPDWTLRPLGIYAVWADKSRRESLTLQFVRFLAEQELC